MTFYDFVVSILKPVLKVLYRVKVIGKENILMEGPLVIASNHISNLDPLLVGVFIPRRLSYMGKKELFDNKLLGYIITKLRVFPVDREKTDISSIKTALRILKNNEALGIFPQGTRSKNEEDLRAKSGVAMFAIKGKGKIIPITIIGKPKIFKRTTLYVDKPISLDEYFDKKMSNAQYEEISQRVLDVINHNSKIYCN